MAVGPKAMVIASSRAIVLLGASEVLCLSNMFFLRPGKQNPTLSLRCEGWRFLNRGEGKYSRRMLRRGCKTVKKR
jgi:hypothetical protein